MKPYRIKNSVLEKKRSKMLQTETSAVRGITVYQQSEMRTAYFAWLISVAFLNSLVIVSWPKLTWIFFFGQILVMRLHLVDYYSTEGGLEGSASTQNNINKSIFKLNEVWKMKYSPINMCNNHNRSNATEGCCILQSGSWLASLSFKHGIKH